MYRYLLFDLDGTILDTNEIILCSFEYVLKKHLDYEVQRSEVMKIFGEPLHKQMSYFSPGLADVLCEAYRKYYAERSTELTKAFPGVQEALAQLHAQGISMGVITNKYRTPAESALREYGLWPYFDFIISGDEVQNPKPHPEALLKAMELMQATPAETLMVGDSPLDLEAGHRAGMETVLVGWTIFPDERFAQFPPAYKLTNMSDLLTILQLDVA